LHLDRPGERNRNEKSIRGDVVPLQTDGGVVAKARRGFAVMDRDKQREIAAKGGRAAHEKGTAHRWSEEEAKEAGRKGGAASHRNAHRTGRNGSKDQLTNQPPRDEPSTEEPTDDDTATMRNGG
jgi:general stress protein YciG